MPNPPRGHRPLPTPRRSGWGVLPLGVVLTAGHLAITGSAFAQRMNADARNRILFWCVVLIITMLVLSGAFWMLRRYFAEDRDEQQAAGTMGLGFSLADLREMHAQGQLSDEEFAVAKQKLISRTRERLAEDEPEPDPGVGPAFFDPADKDADFDDDPDKNGPSDAPPPTA